MEQFQVVLVNDEEYIIQMCSAQQQWDILTTLYSYGLGDALYRIAMGENHLVAMSLLGAFFKDAPRSVLDKTTEMLLGLCTKKDSDKPVTVDDFQGQMFTFSLLHIEALKVNFSDFLPLLQKPEEEPGEGLTSEMDEMSPV